MNTYGKDRRFAILKDDDQSVLAYAKFVGPDNAAGAEVTAATIQQATSTMTFTINAAAEGINTYTGAAGGAGILTLGDTNCNSIQDLLDVINGIGVGMPAPTAALYNRRWRAAMGDFPPLYALTTGDSLVVAAANALLGHRSPGLSLLADSDNLANLSLWVGIGTDGGTIPGANLVIPDYFEDYPGVTGITGFSSNTPDRTTKLLKQEDAGISVERYTPVIDYIAMAPGNSAANVIKIWGEWQNPASDTPLYQSADLTTTTATAFTGPGGSMVLKGRPGKALFVESRAASGTLGAINVGGYYESSLRERGSAPSGRW